MLRHQDLCGHVMVRRGEAFWLWTVLAATCTHDIGIVLPVEALVVILNLIPEILLFWFGYGKGGSIHIDAGTVLVLFLFLYCFVVLGSVLRMHIVMNDQTTASLIDHYT